MTNSLRTLAFAVIAAFGVAMAAVQPAQLMSVAMVKTAPCNSG